jgi:hypothetical protein
MLVFFNPFWVTKITLTFTPSSALNTYSKHGGMENEYEILKGTPQGNT